MSETAPSILQMNPCAPSSVRQRYAGIHDLLQFEAERKSAGIAFTLCWIFGIFGGHRFYLGRSHAVTMLVITIVSIPLCLIFVGFAGLLATGVWMVVDLFAVAVWVRADNKVVLSRIASAVA